MAVSTRSISGSRRRLAYEIAKHAEGIYAVVDLKAEPATVSELDRQLNLNESVLRTEGDADRQALVRFTSERLLCVRRCSSVGSPATALVRNAALTRRPGGSRGW